MKLNNKQVSAVLSAAKAIGESMTTFAESICDVFGECTTDDIPELASQLKGIMDFVSLPTVARTLYEYGFEASCIRIFIKALAKETGKSDSAITQAMKVTKDPDEEKDPAKGGAPTQSFTAIVLSGMERLSEKRKPTKPQREAALKALAAQWGITITVG
jgi:hypothetical protein